MPFKGMQNWSFDTDDSVVKVSFKTIRISKDLFLEKLALV